MAALIEVQRSLNERRLGERVGERGGTFTILDQGPVEKGALELHACPFDIGDGDPAEHAGLDRLDHPRMMQRRDVALALEPRLDRVDAARDVDRKHQLEIDRQILGRRRQAGQGKQTGNESDATRQTRKSHDRAPKSGEDDDRARRRFARPSR